MNVKSISTFHSLNNCHPKVVRWVGKHESNGMVFREGTQIRLRHPNAHWQKILGIFESQYQGKIFYVTSGYMGRPVAFHLEYIPRIHEVK
jgi:hypothetical protein